LRTINRYNEVVPENLEQLDELLHPDYKHLTPPTGMTPTREGIKSYFRMVDMAIGGFRFNVKDTLIDGNKVVQRWTITGTHEGEFLDIPASGKEVEFDGISILELRDGKIYRDATIADTMSLMQQIEAVPALG
jgi:steroid delta-isomerase-like uncharacterized protein